MVDLEGIFRAAARENEARKDYALPVLFSLATAVAVIGNLQMSLRHPDNTGEAARIVRNVIDQMLAKLVRDGFLATAAVAALGDDPRYDT